MDLNKIRLLRKEDLIQKLKQIGFGEVALLLEDKNINGQTLLDLKEFEIFKWRLNPSQKRELWNCIKRIKDKPSILMVQPKPKVLQKPTPAKAKYVDDTETNKAFKNKLKGLLGASATSVGSSSTLPKSAKTRPLPSIQNESRISSKPLPQPPPPSPPPRNNAVKNTNTAPNKTPMSLPRTTKPEPSNQINDDAYYLQMSSPVARQDNSRVEQEPSSDYYLAPINVPPMQRNQNNIPSLAKKKVTSAIRPVEEPEETYENVENTYELSPPGVGIKESRSLPNIPNTKSPVKMTVDDEDAVDYEQFPEEVPNRGHVPKATLKDLAGHIVVVDENPPQQESKFSFLTSKLNIFKAMTRPKYIYENCEIKGEKDSHVEMPVQTRPLPQIPVSPKVTRSDRGLNRRSRSFSRPLPLPREESPISNSGDNYVELSSKPPARKPQSLPQEPDDSEDENQIYENTPKSQNVEKDTELIYGNDPEMENSDGEQQIYENRPNVLGRNHPPTTKTNKYVGKAWPEQIPQRDFKVKEKTENPVKTNQNSENPVKVNKNTDQDQSSSVQTLALLLAEKLRQRDERQHQQNQQHHVLESETESDFDDEEAPIYGNTHPQSVDTENSHPFPIPKEKISEDPPRLKDKETSIFNRALPEIPKRNASPDNAVARTPSPRVNQKRDSLEARTVSNRSRNSSTTLGPPKLLYLSYEHHTMKNKKENENRQRPGIAVPEEKGHDDSIFNLSEEPFYRETDRKGAKKILSRLGNGAFLFRPSETYFLVLNVKHNNKIYNFGIERSSNNKLRLNTEGNIEPPEFSTLQEFVDHFSEEPLTFENSDEIIEIYLETYLQNNISS